MNNEQDQNDQSSDESAEARADERAPDSSPADPQRRRFMTAATTTAMACGLAGGYGTFAVMAGRFLYPTQNDDVRWQYVTMADSLRVGDSLRYVSPSGAGVVIARQRPSAKDRSADGPSDGAMEEALTGDDFIALSSVCPHLGCQVHWEPQNDRFFCPCHNGAFDPQGKATEGPPAKANQELIRFRVRVEDGMLFIFAPVRSIT